MALTDIQKRIQQQSGCSDRAAQLADSQMNAQSNALANAAAVEQKLLVLCKDNLPLLEESWRILNRDFHIPIRDRAGLLRHFGSVENAQAQLPYIVEGAARALAANAPPAPPPEYQYFDKSVPEVRGVLPVTVHPAEFMLELKRITASKGIDLGGKITIECGLDAWLRLEQVSKVYGFVSIVANMRLDDSCFVVRTPDKKKG